VGHAADGRIRSGGRNISYGIFLEHFLSTMSMYWIAEAVYTRTGVFGIFGVPDVAEVRLRVFSFLFAIVFGAVIMWRSSGHSNGSAPACDDVVDHMRR